jgi:hypothetical protein
MKILRHGSIIVVALFAVAIGFMSCSRGGKLEIIAITPASPTIATGTTQQFNAMAIFSNGTAIDWTTAAAWTSDGASVAMINAFGTYGLARSLATGTTGTIGPFTITATDTANNISGTATLEVVDPQSIDITPANPYMAVRTSHQFTATATLLSNLTKTTTTQNITSFATWTTTDSSIATVSSTGLVTTLATAGTVTIVAEIMTHSSGTFPSYTPLTVTDTSLAIPLDVTAVISSVTTSNPIISMATTTTLQFTATGNYPTGTPTTQPFTQSVTWSSSNTSVATISNTAGSSGLATIVSSSTTPITIRATDPITGVSGTATLTVNP